MEGGKKDIIIIEYIFDVFLVVPRIRLQIQNVFTNFEYIFDRIILTKIEIKTKSN